MTAFTVETYQNEYLAIGGTEVHAIVTVTATGDDVLVAPELSVARAVSE